MHSTMVSSQLNDETEDEEGSWRRYPAEKVDKLPLFLMKTLLVKPNQDSVSLEKKLNSTLQTLSWFIMQHYSNGTHTTGYTSNASTILTTCFRGESIVSWNSCLLLRVIIIKPWLKVWEKDYLLSVLIQRRLQLYNHVRRAIWRSEYKW